LTEVLEDYCHENILRESGRKLELDIFLPKQNLALEYQGKHHFHDVYSIGQKWHFNQLRDEEKRLKCKMEGITLIEIPYWWDYQKSSLLATIYAQRPDLFEEPVLFEPIPSEPPGGFPKGIIL
jgi:hypothetical protein